MVRYKYILKIPFELNGNSGIKINDDNNLKFNLDTFEITLNYNKQEQKGHFKIMYFYNENEIFQFYEKFKKTIQLLNLSPTIWCMKIKELNSETIKSHVEFEEIVEQNQEKNNMKITFENQIMISETTLTLRPIMLKSVSEIIDNIKKNYLNISSKTFAKNDKLETSLDLYITSQFQNETSKFLTLITILELLKPNIKRKGIGKNCVDELIKVVDKYKEKSEIKNNTELHNEFNGISTKVKELEEMSINYSIKQIPSENEIELPQYPNMKKMLSESYNIRSKFVHEGIILEGFNECLTFLEYFVPELIKKEIEKLNT